jgi:hypothetical protein
MKLLVAVCLGLCLLAPAPAADAKHVRAEIIFLYDTSGSMASAGDPWGGSHLRRRAQLPTRRHGRMLDPLRRSLTITDTTSSS